jgi:hypothetical protein
MAEFYLCRELSRGGKFQREREREGEISRKELLEREAMLEL